MSTMPIYVIANGDLFREAFNAIVTVLGESTFHTAIRLGLLFSIFGAGLAYMKSHDLRVFAKWVALYFAVSMILLGPKMDVQILDSSNQGAAYNVDNVPYGLAFPASIITSVAYALNESMEDAFHMPDDASYNKTGMLFGSRLYRLSTGFQAVEPRVKANIDQYMQNCVIGDILINNKYSFNDLINSENIWSTISQNPSPVRGINYDNGKTSGFMTCRDATVLLKTDISNDVANNELKFYGVRIFGSSDETTAANKLSKYLSSAYNYYAGLSKSATEIITQNTMINAVRNGITNYNTRTGAVTTMLNLGSAQALEQQRMSWAISHNTAIYMMPLIQTTLLLIILASFPIMVLLSLQPALGVKVFINYIYSLMWVESWTILFAILNFACTFYVDYSTQGLATHGFTLSNSNPLAMEHSDVAGVASYLMAFVPILSIMLVKGTVYAFSSIASSFGGMMHSSASGVAAAVTGGNLSFGNMSYENVNANKWDTNSTHMHGMHTEQLGNGALLTTAGDGTHIINAAASISSLPTSINAGQMLSSSYSKQARAELSAAQTANDSFNSATSNSSSLLNHLNTAISTHEGITQHYANSETASAANHAAQMYGIIENLAKQNGVSFQEAFNSANSLSLGVHGGAGGGTPGISPIKLNGGVNGGFNHNRSSSETTSHNLGRTVNISNEDMRKFNEDKSALQSYAHSHNADISHSKNASLLSQIGSSFNVSESAAHSEAAHLSKAEGLSKLASYSENLSAGVNDNINQQFANHLYETLGEQKATWVLTNNSLSGVEARDMYAERFLRESGIEQKLENSYFNGAKDVSPSKLHDNTAASIAAKEHNLRGDYTHDSKDITKHGSSQGVHFNKQEAENVIQENKHGHAGIQGQVSNAKDSYKNSYSEAKNQLTKDIKDGANKADSSSMPGADVIKHPLKAAFETLADPVGEVIDIVKAAGNTRPAFVENTKGE